MLKKVYLTLKFDGVFYREVVNEPSGEIIADRIQKDFEAWLQANGLRRAVEGADGGFYPQEDPLPNPR